MRTLVVYKLIDYVGKRVNKQQVGAVNIIDEILSVNLVIETHRDVLKHASRVSLHVTL